MFSNDVPNVLQVNHVLLTFTFQWLKNCDEYKVRVH